MATTAAALGTNGICQTSNQLHCAMVPFLGLGGHLIPMMDFGLLLAEHGVAVTVFTTEGTADRLQPMVARAHASSLHIDIEVLPFSTGYAENASTISKLADYAELCGSLPKLAKPLLERLATRAATGNTFLLVDYMHHWTISVGRELAIPRYVFYNMPCFTVLCLNLLQQYYVNAGLEATSSSDITSMPFTIPGIPHRIEMTLEQALGLFPGWDHMLRQFEELNETADGIVFNTASVLESEYIEMYARNAGKKVWSVGPVSLCNAEDPDRAATRGGRPSVEVADIFHWLDAMEPRSVVYFALGSMTKLSFAQVKEIAAGMEASGHPFLCVFGVPQGELDEVKHWLQTSGFMDRNRGRGMVIMGWAPQQAIFSHPSIGGFVTHCGWNSILEAISSGVPMATWPQFGDQHLNERLVVDILGVGVSVVSQPHWCWWWSVNEGVVRKERIRDVVAELMGEGDDAKQRRKKAEMAMVKTRMAMKPKMGESRTALTALVEHVAQHQSSNRSANSNHDQK